jgi:hypothetical protein
MRELILGTNELPPAQKAAKLLEVLAVPRERRTAFSAEMCSQIVGFIIEAVKDSDG